MSARSAEAAVLEAVLEENWEEAFRLLDTFLPQEKMVLAMACDQVSALANTQSIRELVEHSVRRRQSLQAVTQP